MMDKTSAKTVSQMDGKLVAAIGDDENIFEGCKAYDTADAARDAARKYRDEMQASHILTAFRKCVEDFEEKFGVRPLTALLGYNDRQTLARAYALEYEKEHNGRSPPYDIVDGIKFRGGCDQEAGMIQLRRSEEKGD